MRLLSTTVRIINGEHVKVSRVEVHKFLLGDVEDPVLYGRFPLDGWLSTEQGEWVLKHSLVKPECLKWLDPRRDCYEVAVIAELVETDAAIYTLKWG